MSIILITDRNNSIDYRELDLPCAKLTIIGFGDGLEILREANPELVIIDCCENSDYGATLLEKIKKLRPDLPVIFLTDESTEELAIRVFRAGARDYFKKPLRTEELKSAIISILALRRQTPGKRLPLQLARASATDSAALALDSLPANILRMVKFIETNISAPLSLEELAREACLSRFHFSRLFKSHVGIGPKQFILTLRINRAIALLRSLDLTITTVALRAGFNELGEFTRQFRKFTGLTPSAFRNTVKTITPPRNRK